MAKSKLTPIIETGTDTEVVLAGNVIADDESSDVGVAGGAVMGDAVTCGMVSQFIVGDGGSTSSLIFLATRSLFPALGSSTSFYIDMEKEVIYRWSEDTAEYRVVGENLSNITKIIVGVTPGFVSGTLTAAQILLRGMTAVEWNTTDPVLVDGEIGIEKGTCQFKIGDGTNKWSELDYIGAIPDSYVTKTDYAKETEGGVVISSTAINTISVGIDGTMTINTIGGDKITSVLSVEVIPELSWSKITSGKPTTLSGYGITDATPSSHIGSGGTEHAVATELESGFISSYSQKKINDIEAGAEVNIIEVIKKNGSALSVTDKAVDIAIPTKTSEILNDSNFPSDASYVHTDNNYMTAEKNKLAGIESGAEVNIIEVIKKNGGTLSIMDKAVDIAVPTKTSEITNDSNFPSDASYVHTDNNYTTTEKNKLAGIASGAEANVNTDWNATTGDAQLLNKPTTIAGFGITDTYTKTEVDSKITAVYRFKGSVATYGDLPVTGLTEGDIYNVVFDDMNYGWTGTGWDPLGKTYDLASLTANGLMSKEDYAKLASIAAGAEVNVIEVIKKNGATLSVVDKAVDIAVPTKTSEILNDSNFPTDASYVHTDNNYTTAEKTKMTGIETGAEVNNISDANAIDLTDGTDSILHYHSADRNRANHTGTQTANTISDFASTVRTTVLTGLSLTTNAVISATDSILSALGKLQKQISDNLTTLTNHIGDAVAHITGTERTNWNTAYTNNHTHSNKTILDNTTASYTTTEQTKLAGIATGANNYTLPVASATLGGVKSGTDITVDASGNVSVIDDSHNHIISNVDGLQTVLDGKLATTLKGVANGLAELGSDGKVPSAQLPAYVDDVIEGTLATFPAVGETGKIYVDTTTNLNYRWSGSQYVEISPSLALGETSATAYRGDRGKIAYDHSQTTHAPSNATANSSDATLLNRANHTGTQLASTISDFDTEVSNNTDVNANTLARHTHSNKTILDNTTASYTTAEQTKLTGIETGAEVNNISDSDASDLTDGTDSTLHFHSTDRNRANHTGTQTASTISDFATAALTAAPVETTTTIGTLINGATAKTTPVDADLFVMSDSAASYIAKKVTLANLKTVLGGVLAPAAHTHGNITNAGAIGTTATLPIITGTSGVLQVGSFGTTAGTFCQGSDSRLSDARTPLAHNQASSTITDFATAVSTNTDVAASTTARHTHSNKTIVDNITAAYTTAEQTKLSGIAAGAEVNVNADWTAGSGDAQIINKPTTLSSLGVTDIYTKTEVDSLISSSGGGDMMKATYDVTNNGIVDNSEKLGGKSPAYYTNTAIAMAIALS